MGKRPERICAVCRESKLKEQLIRVVKDPNGIISLDVTGKKPGRGAYVCKDPQCIGIAKQKHSLDRALKGKLSENIWLSIENSFEESDNE
jgi:uncharacterized protein